MTAVTSDRPKDDSLVGGEGSQIIIASYTIITAVGLLLAHFIIVTQFHLWHKNWILSKIVQLVNSPIAQILQQTTALIALAPYRNDLYMIWLVVLLIAYDNVFTINGFTLLEKGSQRISREYLFITNCAFIGSLIIYYNTANKSLFYRPLLSLWSLVLLKFIVRLVSYSAAEKAYGIKNTNLVADYMETEHKLSNDSDPLTMKGYKYLVNGEEKVRPLLKPPFYTLEFDKAQNEVVTVEQVWASKKGLLNTDKDGRIKGVCLSFALFKLVRRRFFGFPAAESQEPKTKNFVLHGLLSGDKKNVFRVIHKEIEFLRDFFYTRYPVTFAFGFPIFNVLILVAMLVISLWISAKAFQEKISPTTENVYLVVNKKNVDYRITNGLLIILMMMEIFEVLSFVFSDWMKVTLISQHVRSKTDEKIPFINEMLGLFCKPKLSKSLNNTIGQYSLLKSYNKGGFKRVPNNFVYHTTFAMLASKIPRGMVADKPIVLPEEVKVAIFDALETSGGNFDDRLAPLRHHPGVDVQDLPLFNVLQNRPFHTIMVWHIATSLCEIRPLKNKPIVDDSKYSASCIKNCVSIPSLINQLQPIIGDLNCSVSCITNCVPTFLWKRMSPEKEVTKTHHLVASSLSKYCAYLLVFAPELLLTSTYSSKRIFDQIVLETSEFLKTAHSSKEQYELMMKYKRNEDEDQKIVEMGAELAKYLIEKIPDDVERWKLMADVWSELILFLAPSGATSGHLEKLANGGEFITHLWTLLYHAGIVVNGSEEFRP